MGRNRCVVVRIDPRLSVATMQWSGVGKRTLVVLAQLAGQNYAAGLLSWHCSTNVSCCRLLLVVLLVTAFRARAGTAAAVHPAQQLVEAAVAANKRGDFERAVNDAHGALAVFAQHDRAEYSNATHLAAHLWNVHIVAAMSLKVQSVGTIAERAS